MAPLTLSPRTPSIPISRAARSDDALAGETIKGFAADRTVIARAPAHRPERPLLSADDVRAALLKQESYKVFTLSGKDAQAREKLLDEFRRNPQLEDGRVVRVLKDNRLEVVPKPHVIELGARAGAQSIAALESVLQMACERKIPVKIKIEADFDFPGLERRLSRMLMRAQEVMQPRNLVIEVDSSCLASLKHFVSVKKVVALDALPGDAAKSIAQQRQELAKVREVVERISSQPGAGTAAPQTFWGSLINATLGRTAPSASDDRAVVWVRRPEIGEEFRRGLAALGQQYSKSVRFLFPEQVREEIRAAAAAQQRAAPSAADHAAPGPSRPLARLWRPLGALFGWTRS